MSYPYFPDRDARLDYYAHDDLTYGDGFNRMQTNSAWSSFFQFIIGTPPIPYPIKAWLVKGVARRINLPETKYVDLALGGRLTLTTDPSQLKVTLTEDDTLFLDVGRIQFEILRIDPLPQRPILKFEIENYAGVVW
jgi:hypothetical protein